jgi:uncharacterized protein GlcG (DUF336 family)
MPTPRRVRSSLLLADARAIIDAAFDFAAAQALLPLAVAVLDGGAVTVAALRQDGASVMRTEIAHAKAWGALAMGLPSRAIAERLREHPGFVNALATISHGRFAPVPGGVLILDENDEAIGAVGISGDTADQDEACALAAITAAGLRSDPAPSVRLT